MQILRSRARAFNPQVFLELLCFAAFAGTMLHLALSGKYLQYVVPRLRPYLIFTAVVMGLWALAGLGRLFQPRHRIRAAHCLVLAAPLLLLLLPQAPLSAGDLSASYAGAGALSAPVGEVRTQATSALPGLDPEGRTILVSDEDFGFWIAELYANMEAYRDYTVSMTGFVINDPSSFAESEFVPARMMMTCCVGDLSPVGLLCVYDQAHALEADSWVRVEGKLVPGWQTYGSATYNDPWIQVSRIEPAEEVPGYVYLD